MHKKFQILKVANIVDYKLSKSVNFLLNDTPKLPETLVKLIVRMDSIHTRNTRQKHQLYSKKENRAIEKRQLKCQPSKTWNSYPIYIKTTKTHSQLKKAFCESIFDGCTSSTLKFAPSVNKQILLAFSLTRYGPATSCKARIFFFFTKS